MDLEHLLPESNDVLEILEKDGETNLKEDWSQHSKYQKLKIKQKIWLIKIYCHEKPQSIITFKENKNFLFQYQVLYLGCIYSNEPRCYV